jgi:arylsulfatase A-like enzyme
MTYLLVVHITYIIMSFLVAAIGVLQGLILGYLFGEYWLNGIHQVRKGIAISLPGFIYQMKHHEEHTHVVRWKFPEPKSIHGREKPNIVLIIADDLGIHDLSSGAGVPTPHIDSLRHNGLHFVHAYAAQATCAPSRAAIFTGRNPTDIGFEFTPIPLALSRAMSILEENPLHPPVYHFENLFQLPDFVDMTIPLDVPTIAESIREVGYNNYLIGKWHLGQSANHTPLDRGFDETLTFPVGFSSYLSHNDPNLVEIPLNGSFAMFDKFLRYNLPFTVSHNNGPPFPPDEYMTDYLSNRACDLLTTLQDSSNPFFLALAYTAPHSPLQALRSDFDDPALSHLQNNTAKVYAAMIKALDRGIGQVLQTLQETDQLENTLIIFTSDNGGAHYVGLPCSNYPFRGWKGTFFEGGIRVPLFMQWKNHIHGNITSKKIVSLRDIFDLIVSTAHHDTASFAKCTNETISSSISHPASSYYRKDNLLVEMGIFDPNEKDVSTYVDHLFWRVGHYKAIRIGNWKLQLTNNPNKLWFHNLFEDPTEAVNIAAALGYDSQSNFITLFEDYSQQHDLSNSMELLYHTDRSLSRYDKQLQLLVAAFYCLQVVNAQQSSPLWPGVIEIAIPIDRTTNNQMNDMDEYVYTVN